MPLPIVIGKGNASTKQDVTTRVDDPIAFYYDVEYAEESEYDSVSGVFFLPSMLAFPACHRGYLLLHTLAPGTLSVAIHRL